MGLEIPPKAIKDVSIILDPETGKYNFAIDIDRSQVNEQTLEILKGLSSMSGQEILKILDKKTIEAIKKRLDEDVRKDLDQKSKILEKQREKTGQDSRK